MPSKPRRGKATKPVPSGRCAKKKRNKALTEANKEQELIAQHLAVQGTKAQPQAETPAYEGIIDRILGEFPKGTPALEFKPAQGKPYDIDIDSEGFEDHPVETQLKAYRYYHKKMSIWRAVVKKYQTLAQVETLTEKQINQWRYQWSVELKSEYPTWKVSLVNSILHLNRFMFCYYKKHPPTDHNLDIKAVLIELFEESKGWYGKRRLCQAIRNKHNIYISVATVAKLMRECGLVAKGVRKRSKYSSYLGTIGRLCLNLINRKFDADGPNQKIVTDVSEFEVNGEKLYLSPFIDLYNNRIIAFTLSRSPSTQFVCQGLKEVLSQLDPTQQCIIHSDQGFQYQTPAYQSLIRSAPNVVQSMSRKGNCLDNAVAESFFGRMKVEIYHDCKYDSIEHLAQAIHHYCIEYNNTRIQIGLNGATPVNFIN